MNQTKFIFLIFLLLLISSCKQNTKVINPNDYIKYLDFTINEKKLNTELDISFWKQKLDKTPNQFIYNAKLASAYTTLFLNTGNIKDLKEAEINLKEINTVTNYANASYLRDLARNYISQHKFKEALQLLKLAEENGEKLVNTQLMLIDVYLELGNKKNALYYLDKVKDMNSFDYLIRLSKYNDFIGDLDGAITYLEKASQIAIKTNNDDLIGWAYTNLADYYGHAGRINDSYTFYLKALALNPSNNYALKGIAWVAFSNDKNTTEANRILDLLLERTNHPDYHLLKAEIADFLGDEPLKNKHLDAYKQITSHPDFGNMYAKYNILLDLDKNNVTNAIKLAEKEVSQRATAQSYALLAYAKFKNKQLKDAQTIIENKVLNQTFEPELLLFAAEICKAANQHQKVSMLKDELQASTYELGPVTAKKISQL